MKMIKNADDFPGSGTKLFTKQQTLLKIGTWRRGKKQTFTEETKKRKRTLALHVVVVPEQHRDRSLVV